MIKYIRSLNWGGYFFMLALCALFAMANKSVVDFLSWLVVFLIGAFISLFVLFAGRSEL